jgi:hypothetical protein
MSSYFDFTIVSANIWDNRGQVSNPFGRVDDVIMQVREALPEGGISLDIGDEGSVWLMRSDPFIDYLNDPDDITIVRGIARVVIRNYIL